uniref:Uncharacterized protein n=1 Tax=Cannabis sativa TaxID=3483 RepID=A0A803QH66_CANSA
MLRVTVCFRNIGTMPAVSIMESKSPRVLCCANPFCSVLMFGKYIRGPPQRHDPLLRPGQPRSYHPFAIPKISSVGFTFPRKTIPSNTLDMQKEKKVNKALKGRLEAERLQVRRRDTVPSAVQKAKILDSMHTLPLARHIVEVEAFKKFLTFKVALLALRTAKEADMLVTELEKVKVDNRDLRNANNTLLAELTGAKL